MTNSVTVRSGMFRDSITLMKISRQVSEMKGVKQAAVVMATPLNKRYLNDIGLRTPDLERAGPNDLVTAVEAVDDNGLEAALAEVDRLLSYQKATESTVARPSSLEGALRLMPDANLVVISVPGQYAKREAMSALERGLNVFLFSSNVPIEAEVQLKTFAREKGLLVMGPDCGTAIINDVVLGFGNLVNRGAVGFVSASGTGLQQVSTLISNAGFGISQAIGTGGNDLSKEVRGIMMTRGIKLLEEDKSTRAIVLISKTPSPSVAEEILDMANSSKKPVIVNFLGSSLESRGKRWHGAATLEDAAETVCAILMNERPKRVVFTSPKEKIISLASAEFSHFSDTQRYVRGLFSGGTLCYEALTVLSPLLGGIHSNTPLEPRMKLKDENESVEHTCVDMGSEEYTAGRAHPMIDFTLRKLRILQEARDPKVAVVLLDVVLGRGAHPDPAVELAPTIAEAKSLAKKSGRFLSFVVSVVGTSKDPQNLREQKSKLEKAGVVIMPSNAQAARMATIIATRNAETKLLFGGGSK